MRQLAYAGILLAATAGTATADCKSDIAALFAAHMSAGPYHVSMTSNAGGQVTTFEADVILPGSFHVKSPAMEMIMIDKNAWMNVGGQWAAMPAQASGMMSSMIDSGMKKGIDGVENPQCLGAQDYEGASYEAYAFESSGEFMGINSTSHITMYVADTGLAAWIVIEGEAMGVNSTTVQKITPDPSITISPP